MLYFQCNCIVNVGHLYCTLIYFGVTIVSDPYWNFIQATINTFSQCTNGEQI